MIQTSKSTENSDAPKPGAFKATLLLGGGFGLLIFMVGMIAGVTSVSLEAGRFGMAGVIGLVIALLTLILAGWLLRTARRSGLLTLPRSPRMRRSRLALYIALGTSFAIGIIAGVTGQISGTVDNFGLLFTSTPISTSLALVAIAGWFIALAASAWWHSTLDEFERAEYEFGASLGMYTYVILAPIWWIAWRGGLAPEPDGLTIFWLVCVVWAIGWLWRRYR